MAEFTPHEAPAHDAQSLPVKLPAKLIGRDLVLARVYQQLKDNMPVLIYGPSGVGKTALAATLASAYTDLPGGVLWMHLHHPTLADMLVHVGRAYDVSEIATSNNPVAMVGAVASTLMQHKPLVVLDGEFDVQTAQDFVSRCADRLPTLLLADEQLVGPWTAVSLPKLEPEQAKLMFLHLAGMDGPEGEENDADIDSLMEVCEFMPFAIAVAAGAVRASGQPPAEFLSSLPRQPGVGGTVLALTAAFRGLTAALQGLLLIMGATMNGEASDELLSLMSSAPQPGIRQAMSLLTERHLVETITRYGSPLYRLHPITYAFTQPLLRGSGKLDSLREKTRDSVLTYAETYSAATPSDYDRLAMVMDTFLSTARWAAERGEGETINRLANALMQAGDFVNTRGYVYELLMLRRLGASSTTAFPAHDPSTMTQPGTSPLPFEAEEEADEAEIEAEFDDYEADEVPALAEAETVEADEDETDDIEPVAEDVALPFDLRADDEDADRVDSEDELEDEFDEPDEEAESELEADGEMAIQPPLPAPEPAEVSRLRPMLAQARQQGNLHRQSALLTQMGQQLVQAGMDNEAISTYSEALTVFEAIDERNGILNTLETLAALTVKTANSQAAVLHATRGVQLAEEAGDEARKARFLMTLGDAREQLGEGEQAISAYSRALTSAQAANLPELEAMILFRLGYAQLDDNQPQAAITTWERALDLFKAQGKRDYEGRVLGGLGQAYGDLNRWTEAIAFHTSALFIAREVGDRDEQALQLSNLGYASVQAQQLGQAVLRYRQALHLAYESNNRDNIVSTIVDLARLLVESPRHLAIAELLIDDALRLEPGDRDVRRLKERIEQEMAAAKASGIDIPPVSGTARQYAANAYALMEAS